MTEPSLVQRVLAGDPRALARAISLVEDQGPAGADLIRGVFGATGRACVIGVTGSPGAGKSTLVDRLTSAWRASARRVGVLAVDPTSPFTGGAILGDRVRMQAHAGDPGVFIRSMATRGHPGGLARATGEAALVLDAAGFDPVVIETVGVGQAEVEIARTADVSIVLLVPGAGDDVQALKAGLMEIADIFVVNKADRDGADRAVASVESMLSLQPADEAAGRPPVVRTVATAGEGIPALLEAIEQFRSHAPEARERRVRERVEHRVRELLWQRVREHVERRAAATGALPRLFERVARREIDPYTGVDELVARMMGSPAEGGPDERRSEQDA